MKNLKNLVALALLSTLTSAVFAQNAASVPRLVNFSGKAGDAEGHMIAGAAGVTFAIYKEQTGGNPLWIETQAVNADAKGNYTAQLGATKPAGLPLDLFTSGEARWLGVRVNGGEEQPRVMLLSVPYALKAGDAATLGGMPLSAFVLAAPMGGSQPAAANSNAGSDAPPINPSVTGVGTIGSIPLWDSASDITSSILTQLGSGSTARLGVNFAVPSATLDVKGTSNFRGTMTLPSAGLATASGGKNSYPFVFATSAFNSTSKAPALEDFRWQAEPAGNNTASPSATLNLLFSISPAAAAETGFSINSNGRINFAPGQVFPGTAASVGLSAPSSDFTVSGSPVTSSGTLALNWTVAPTNAATANAIVKRDALGSFSAGPITVVGNSLNPGLSATNASGDGVDAVSTATGSAGVSGKGSTGVFGSGSAQGVYGSGGAYGVTAIGSTYGVWAYGSPTGVRGDSIGSGFGLYGTSTSGSGYGVYGTNTNGTAVAGLTYSNSGYGVYGNNVNGGTGAAGISTTYVGVYGQSGSGGWGMDAYNTSNGTGILAGSASGYAGWFNGNVEIEGTLSGGAASFKIDHPIDPANKYLSHSAVESPDMMNIYNGNVTTDAQGDAVVSMPDWFESLNRDFRYQLTVIGQFAQAIVSSEIANSRFSIKTDKPNVKVSWQVTGVRQDAWANAHRIPVEEVKPEAERGFYLHPELFGAPDEKGILWAHSPQVMKQWREARTKDAALKTGEVLSKQ